MVAPVVSGGTYSEQTSGPSRAVGPPSSPDWRMPSTVNLPLPERSR